MKIRKYTAVLSILLVLSIATFAFARTAVQFDDLGLLTGPAAFQRYTTFNQIVTAVAGVPTVVIINAPLTATTVASPANLTVEFKAGGSITPNAGQTVTFNSISNIIASPTLLIFPNIGTGNINFANGGGTGHNGWWPTLTRAIADIGAVETTLKVSTVPAILTAGTVSPATLSLIWLQGAIIDLANFNLTINGNISAKLYQLFDESGAGNVALVGTAYPEWWGIDGAVDDVQINAALDSGALTVVLTGPTVYELVDYIEFEFDKQRLTGVNWPTLRTAAITSLSLILLADNLDDLEVDHIIFDGNDANSHCIEFQDGGNRPNIHHNQINDCFQYGIVLGDTGVNNGGFDGAKIEYNVITGIGRALDAGTETIGIEIFPRFGALAYSDNIEIAHNWIHSFNSFKVAGGIKTQNYTTTWVHHNKINLTAATTGVMAGITVQTSTNVKVEHNEVIEGNTAYLIPGGTSVAVSGQFITTAIITDNAATGSIRLFHSTGGMGADYTITDNIGRGLTSNGIKFDTSAEVWETGYGKVIISGNELSGTQANIDTLDTNAAGYASLIISNNIISQAITTEVDNTIIESNFIDSPATRGIRAIGDDVKIFNNTIWQPNQDNDAGAGARAGIDVQAASRPQIRGNTIDNGATGNARLGVELRTVVSPKVGINYIRGMVTGDYIFDTVTNLFGVLTGADTTPDVGGGDVIWVTGSGALTITAFINSHPGQIIEIHALHDAVVITDGGNIVLNGSANFTMNITDTLTLRQSTDGKWYEVARSDNS